MAHYYFKSDKENNSFIYRVKETGHDEMWSESKAENGNPLTLEQHRLICAEDQKEKISDPQLGRNQIQAKKKYLKKKLLIV